MKRLVIDLTKIPFLKRLIGISRLIVEVLDDQNLFTESNLAYWFLSYVQFLQVIISQNELKLLGSVEKLITLKTEVGMARTLKEDQPLRLLLNLLVYHFNRSESTYKSQRIKLLDVIAACNQLNMNALN